MRIFLQDLRFAARILSANRGFATVAVLTLALGIASVTTVFGWIDGLLWHPFPGSARSSQLAVLEMSIPSAPNGGTSVSWLDYLDYRDHLKLVSGVTVQRYTSLSLGEGEAAHLAWGELVSASYFEVLGVQPLLGRLFVSGGQSDTPGAYPVAVISERLWRSEFGADPHIVGKPIRVNRRPLTVIGVAPARFHGTAPAMVLDLWLPASMGVDLSLFDAAMFKARQYRDFATMVVCLKPGVSIAMAQAEVSALAASLAVSCPATNRGVSATLSPPWLAHGGAGELLLRPLRILMAVSMLLLLIVCANVANLLLARSMVRYREFGVRMALGASRWRVVRQLMTETLLLAILGAVAGLFLLPWMGGVLLALLPDVGLPVAHEFDLDGRVLLFTALCCVFSALMASAAPALFSARANLNQVLKEGGRGGMSGTATHRIRSLLVMAEVALAAVALTGAGLFGRSFQNAREIKPGFDSSGVLFARIFMDGTTFTADQQADFAVRLRRRLESESSVLAAGYADFTPLSTTAGPYDQVEPAGYTRAPGESMEVSRAVVAPGYFSLLRIPLLDGRDFRDEDETKAAPVIIVNQAFARRFFHGANPLGRKVRLFDKWATVIGLARDSKYFNPAEPPQPYFYLSFRQFHFALHELYYFVRTAGSPAKSIGTLRRAIADTDSRGSSFHAAPLTEYTQVSLFPQKVAASLMGAIGAMCLFLAALGLYSVMSCAVNQRAQEIGVRMAMGACPANVIGMVIRQGMALAAIGLVAGTAAAFVVARLVSAMLVGVSAADPATFAAAALFLALVALFATWLPAHRATRIEPIVALRPQ